MKMRKLLWLCSLLLPLITHAEEGNKEKQKTYRWVDRAGVVHFSSSPPPAGIKGEEIELRQPNAVIQHEHRELLLEQGRAVGEAVDARLEERQKLMEQIDETEAALTQAKDAYEKGEAPQPGERQAVAGGGSRLSAQYLQRREAEEQQIRQLEQQLKELYQQLDMLR